MIPEDICRLIFIDILNLIEGDSTPKLKTLSQIEEIMLRHFPDTSQLGDLGIRAFTKAMAKCWLPELIPYLDTLLNN
jgi:hypothetical protein